MPDPKKPHGQYLTQTGTQDGKALCIDGGTSVGGAMSGRRVSDRAALLEHNANEWPPLTLPSSAVFQIVPPPGIRRINEVPILKCARTFWAAVGRKSQKHTEKKINSDVRYEALGAHAQQLPHVIPSSRPQVRSWRRQQLGAFLAGGPGPINPFLEANGPALSES